MITKPQGGSLLGCQKCWRDCLVSGPRLLQDCIVLPAAAQAETVTRQEQLLLGGRALWVVSHLQASSQDAGLFVAHMTLDSLFCHLPKTTS